MGSFYIKLEAQRIGSSLLCVSVAKAGGETGGGGGGDAWTESVLGRLGVCESRRVSVASQ